MEREREDTSSRSPDSSCPDYSSYSATLNNPTARIPNPSISNAHISSSTESSLASSSLGIFQNRIGESICVDDVIKPISENSSRGPSYHDSLGNFSSFPAVGSYWPSSSSASNSSSSSQPPPNYQSSASAITGARNVSSTTTTQGSSINHSSSSYAPYFFTACNVFTDSTDPSLPKTEHSNVSSSITNVPKYSSPTSSSYMQYCATGIRHRKNNLATRTSSIDPSSSKRNHSAEQHQSFYLPTQHSAENSTENNHNERGFKRKSSLLSTLTCLSSTPSSLSNNMPLESSLSNNMPNELMTNSKRKKVPDSISYLNLDLDDDVQIIEPEINRDFINRSTVLTTGQSSSTSNCLHRSSSSASHHNPSVISYSNISNPASNTAKQTVSDSVHQNPRQITLEVALNQSLPPVVLDDVEQLLDIVWADSIAPPSSTATSVDASAVETITIPNDDDSSSSIASVHEVPEESSSCDTDQQPLLTLEEVPDAVPSVIVIEDSPDNDEQLLQLKEAKQEAENVKEDFKKLLEDELICNICTELLIKPVTLGCSHTFCKFCISEWKAKKNQCPMCRASIATETPCLFMDNFISKAVEQLDPTSVEKRLEIIKMREEQLKSKIVVRPTRLPQSSSLNQYPLSILTLPPYLTHQNIPNSAHSLWQHSTPLQPRFSLIGQLGTTSSMMPQNAHSMQRNTDPGISVLDTDMPRYMRHRNLSEETIRNAHLAREVETVLMHHAAQQRANPPQAHVSTEPFFFF